MLDIFVLKYGGRIELNFMAVGAIGRNYFIHRTPFCAWRTIECKFAVKSKRGAA